MRGWLVLGFVCLAGCSSYDASDPVVSTEQTRQELSAAWCDRIEQCDETKFAATWKSKSECVDALVRDGSNEKDDSMRASQLSSCKQRIASTPCASIEDKVTCSD